MPSTRKLKKHPTIVCYRDVQELIIIKDWFYNFDNSKDNRYKAIQKVKALSSRGKLPHAIESTSLLTSIILTDPKLGGTGKDSNVLQLSYTMALIRFVNGLLDPFQQSSFAIPLHQLAKNLNLPSFFVELRHMGTHESLPNLDILRIASRQALSWLHDHYWNSVDETISDIEDEETEVEKAEITRLTPIMESCILNLKTFKKIRKQDLNQIIKYGNSSESGMKYWKAITNLKKLFTENLSVFIKTLIYKNFIIYNNDKILTKETKKYKFNALLIKLYKPLIDEFGNDFKLRLLFAIFHSLNEYVCDDFHLLDIKLGFHFKHGDEIKQIREWGAFLIQDLLSQNITSDKYPVNSVVALVNLIIDKFQKVDIIYQILFMKELQSSLEKLQSSSQAKKDLYSKVSNLYKQLKIRYLAAPPSLDDILNDSIIEQSSERPSKKQKIDSADTPTKPNFLFEIHEDWSPKPFEIDLPNLEEVSLNNIVLRNVSIDPDKVGKLPGCNLRYGQVESLELNGGVMGGVSIDANNVELVIAPDFDMKEESGSNVQFLLAQSTADLANTLMVDKLQNDEDSSDDEDRTIRPPTSTNSRSDSSSSSSSAKPRPSALSGVMARAVELAVLRLQVKMTSLNIKIVSESTDLLLKIDEVFLSTINGSRHIKVKGINLITLRPNVNPGESPGEDQSHESTKRAESDNISDEDEDIDNNYGDESLMDSMVFTHDEASSIYMSATSQSFNKDNNTDSREEERDVESKVFPILLHIDDIEIQFEGLSSITNLEIDVGEVKISSIPISPTIISIFNNISNNLKSKYYQQRKLKFNNQKFKSNSSFPQYADDNDELEEEGDQLPVLEDNSSNQDPFFERLHINNIVLSVTSALLPTGKFASESSSLNFVFHNVNIKYKNETLIYGGVEEFKIIKSANYEKLDVFKFSSNSFASEAESGLLEQAKGPTSPPSSSLKADIRFEVFTKSDKEVNNREFTVLFSKQAFINLDTQALLWMINFGLSISTVYENYNTMKSTMSSINTFGFNTNRNNKDTSLTSTAKNETFQFILQTASTTIQIRLSDCLDLKTIVFPISFNLLKHGMSINKILVSTISNGIETLVSTISNIQLITILQNFKSFVNRSGYASNTDDSFPHEVAFSSSLTLSVSEITSKISLEELSNLMKEISNLTSLLELLPTQINSFENSLKYSQINSNYKLAKIESSRTLQNLIYSNQRRLRRPAFNNASLLKSNRSNVASFRLYVDHFDLNITNVLPKLGDFDIQFRKISFYKLNNDISGSVHTLNVDRNFGENKLVNHFIYEFQKKELNEVTVPLILVNYKRSEKMDVVVVTVRNLLIEYYTQWLELLEKEIDENAVLHDITDKKNETLASLKSTTQKRFDIRFLLFDCIIGLNPGRLSCKSFLIVSRGNSDVTLGLHQFYIKSSLRNLSFLIIDNVKNLSKADKSHRKVQNSGYISPLSWFLSRGYICIGNINCTHLGITVNTGIQEIIKKNKNLGIEDDLSLLDIKINSDEHQLDLCADSAYVLVQLINDLKPPLYFSNEDKVKVKFDDNINLLDGVSENEFKNERDLYSPNTSDDFDEIVKIPKISDSSDINIVDEYYDDLHASSQSLEKGMKKLNLNDSTNVNVEESVLEFDEEHFSNTSAGNNKSEISPIKLNINLSKTKIYLYDGFDWKATRKTIKGAVKRVELQALQELESKKESGPKMKENFNSQVKFEEQDQSSINEEHFDGEEDHEVQDGCSESQLLFGETLFQSIHLSLPKGSSPSNLTKNINKSVQNNLISEDSQDLSINYNVESGNYYKHLKLRRSKSHKISIDLKNIEVNMTIHTTRDPRRDKEVPDVDYETINSIELRIEDADVYDNLPNSTWNKFLSYMNSLGEREIGTSMVKASITTVRPDPELCSTEAIIGISVLPIRLHVDQDALDFFVRFFEFKDKRFELPIDEILYIQMFKMNSLRLKLDYKPKKIDYAGIRSGKVAEFVNFFILDGSELNLPKLKLYGLLGIPMLGAKLARAWTPYIQQTQLAGLLVGLSPLRSIINISGGVKDLIAVPIKEYQKDGRLIRSLQKGTSKFAKTTGYELLNLGAKLASGTQVILEQSEEAFGGEGSMARSPKNRLNAQEKEKPDKDDGLYVTGSNNKGTQSLLASSQLLNKSVMVDNSPYANRKLYSYVELDETDDIDDKILENSLLLMNPNDLEKSRKKRRPGEDDFQITDEKEDLGDDDTIKLVSLYSNQPENTLQGLRFAYKSLGENFKITKKAIKTLRQDLHSSPNVQESLKTLLKSSPILIIRPMIGTTEALLKTLLGISNEIDSNQIIESKDKYRYENSSQR